MANMLKNAFIKDNDGNVYYFDNSGRMAVGEKTIDGKQYFFLANGVQLRDGYRQNRRGQVFYYDQNGVLNANGKQDPKPEITITIHQAVTNSYKLVITFGHTMMVMVNV